MYNDTVPDNEAHGIRVKMVVELEIPPRGKKDPYVSYKNRHWYVTSSLEMLDHLFKLRQRRYLRSVTIQGSKQGGSPYRVEYLAFRKKRDDEAYDPLYANMYTAVRFDQRVLDNLRGGLNNAPAHPDAIEEMVARMWERVRFGVAFRTYHHPKQPQPAHLVGKGRKAK